MSKDDFSAADLTEEEFESVMRMRRDMARLAFVVMEYGRTRPVVLYFSDCELATILIQAMNADRPEGEAPTPYPVPGGARMAVLPADYAWRLLYPWMSQEQLRRMKGPLPSLHFWHVVVDKDAVHVWEYTLTEDDKMCDPVPGGKVA